MPQVASASTCSSVAPCVGALGEPGLERLLGAALDHVEQRCWAGSVTDPGQVDDHADVLVAASGVAPHMLIDTHDLDAVEAVLFIDQHSLALSEDGVVGGVPRDPEPFSDPGHGQVPDHDPLRCPPQPATRQLRPRLGRQRGVLAPHVPAAGASVAPHRHFQHGGTPAQRFVRQAPDHGVPRYAFGPAAAAPLVRLDHPAREHRAIGVEPLADGFETQVYPGPTRQRSLHPQLRRAPKCDPAATSGGCEGRWVWCGTKGSSHARRISDVHPARSGAERCREEF